MSAPISPIAEHTTIPIPKASPKPKLFTLKRDHRSRSNSSGLNVRRFSTDSIFGERLDTIGRRLSRDVTQSPADLGRKFKTFGKENSSNTLDVHSQDQITDHYAVPTKKFDTLPTKVNPVPILKSPMRNFNNDNIAIEKRIHLDVPGMEGNNGGNNGNELTIKREKPERPSLLNQSSPGSGGGSTSKHISNRKRMPLPPTFQMDLQNKLHEELKEKYGHNNKNSSSTTSCNARN